MVKNKKMSSPPNVFKYDDYRRYLSDFYEFKKLEMPGRFSYRYLSQKAGFQTSTFLHRVIIGKRNLTLESIRKLAAIIPLKGRPYQYFETLVMFNQAKEEDERLTHFEALKEFKEYIALRLINEDQNMYLYKWYYPVVREMIKWPQFKGDPVWISKQIKPGLTPEQAKEALEVLLQLRLAKVNADGTWEQTYPKLMTKEEGLGHEVLNYHKNAIQLGMVCLKQPAKERHVSAMTISVSPAIFELMRQKIYIFHKEISGLISQKINKNTLKEYNVSEELMQSQGFFDVSEVCQFNLQMFKVAKLEKTNED